MAVKSDILRGSGGYCAVPTFLRVFPVSATCLPSSFKSIYCSQKSICLSEERCIFWYSEDIAGGALTFSLSSSYTHSEKKKVMFFVFFFGWWQWGRSVLHLPHLRKRARARWDSSMDSQINGRRLSPPQPETEKALYAGSNHITRWHHPSLRQSFLCPQSHFLMVEIISCFSQSHLISQLYILFFIYSAYPPPVFSSLPPSNPLPSLLAAALNVAFSVV